MPVRANMLTLRQAGLTLVELLVAMVLMLLVAIATVAMYNVSSSSYRTVDANQELQDSARFAMEIIGQAARSAGYQDRTGPPTTEKVYVDQVFGPTIREAWRVEGRNGQTLSGGNSLTYSTSGVVNSSDALVVRFFGANLPDPANPSVAKVSGGKPVPDGSMIDCSGRALPYPVGSADVGVSAFFVKVLNGEPELYCKSWNSNAATPAFSDTQVVRSVETLQIVYGVDTNNDEVADKWLGAASISDDPAVSPNWNNVVAMRVGMVLRGSVGSSQGQSATASENDLYPLGKAFTCENTATSCTPTEAAHRFTPPADNRLRRAFATTFMFRSGIQ